MQSTAFGLDKIDSFEVAWLMTRPKVGIKVGAIIETTVFFWSSKYFKRIRRDTHIVRAFPLLEVLFSA